MAVEIFEIVITPLRMMIENYLLSSVWTTSLGFSIVGAIAYLLSIGLIVRIILTADFSLITNQAKNANNNRVKENKKHD